MKCLAGAIWLLFLVVGVDVAAPSSPPPAWWSSISLTGILAVISLLTLSIIQIITASRAGRIEKVITQAVPIVLAQDQKLAEQSKKLDLVAANVDPRILQELADIKQMFADVSQRRGDQVKADVAQVRADAHEAKIVEMKQAAGLPEEEAKG